MAGGPGFLSPYRGSTFDLVPSPKLMPFCLPRGRQRSREPHSASVKQHRPAAWRYDKQRVALAHLEHAYFQLSFGPLRLERKNGNWQSAHEPQEADPPIEDLPPVRWIRMQAASPAAITKKTTINQSGGPGMRLPIAE